MAKWRRRKEAEEDNQACLITLLHKKQKKKIILDWWGLQALGKSITPGHWELLHQSLLHVLAWNNFCQNQEDTATCPSTWNVL